MIFARDLGNPEEPVALPDGTWLIVEGAALPVSRDGLLLWDGTN